MERTYRLLFRPFAWATFLKLSAVAAITEGIVVNIRFSLPAASSSDAGSDVPSFNLSAILAAPGFVLFAVLGAVAAILIGLLVFYLVTQLRFAFFHCLVHQTRELQPCWSLYRVQTERFFKASLLVWLTLLGLAILTLGVVVVAAWVLVGTPTEDGKLDLGHFFILFTPCAFIVLFLILAAIGSELVLHDFILPHMALENATFREAWTAVRRTISADREAFLSYFILRLLLPLIAAVVLFIAASIVLLIVFGILGMSAAGFNVLLEDATGVGAYLLMGLNTLFVLLGLGIGSVVAVSLGGPLGVYIRNYALLFYGGHYKALGDLLYPPLPPADSSVNARWRPSCIVGGAWRQPSNTSPK